MKKTSVMIEVSEEIYNSIVEPYKKRKSFGKLVTQLLEEYYENENFYGYLNGKMDGLEEEAIEDLYQSFNNSLSMLNMLGNQAEAVVDNAERDFEDIRNGNFAGSGDVGLSVNNFEVDEDVHAVTEEDVKRILSEELTGVKDVLDSINNLLSRQGEVYREPVREQPRVIVREVIKETSEDTGIKDYGGYREEVKSEPVVENKRAVEEFREEVKPTVVEKEKPEFYESITPSEEEQEMAQSALDSLMSSLGNF